MGIEHRARPAGGRAGQERETEAGEAVGLVDRHVGFLVHRGLDPVLLALGHRDPERAGRQRFAPSLLPVGPVVGHGQGAREPVHLDVHPLQHADEPLRLRERVRSVVSDEVVPHRRARHLDPHSVVALVDAVRQQVSLAALLHGFHRCGVPVQVQLAAAGGGRRERDPHDGVVLVPPPVDRGAVVDLDRHPRSLEPERGHGIGEDRREEVVAVTLVEVVPSAPLELLGHGRTVDVVDVVDLSVCHLVIDGVVGRREECPIEAELVMVGQHERRILAHELDLAVGLGLGATEMVAVEIERVVVAAKVERPPVGILDRDHDHHGVLEDPVHDTVVAIGETVDERDDGVCAALLVAVDVPAHPQERRRRVGEVLTRDFGVEGSAIS